VINVIGHHFQRLLANQFLHDARVDLIFWCGVSP